MSGGTSVSFLKQRLADVGRLDLLAAVEDGRISAYCDGVAPVAPPGDAGARCLELGTAVVGGWHRGGRLYSQRLDNPENSPLQP
jgi:hypothetical protein